jgi:hypothetical protein
MMNLIVHRIRRVHPTLDLHKLRLVRQFLHQYERDITYNSSHILVFGVFIRVNSYNM